MKKTLLLITLFMLCMPVFANTDGDDYHYFNPVQKTPLPDPTLIRAADGNFYLFATEEVRNVPIYQSSDLVNWHFLGTAFTDETRPDIMVGIKGQIWAPDINYINGKYVIYYTMSTWGGHWICGIGVAVADKVEGPYKDLGKLFLSPDINVENSIDQFYFEEEDGSKWLFWGSFRGIYAIELSDDGLSLKEGAVKQRVAGSLTEGTSIYKKDGHYYMIGSAGTCCVGEKSTYHLVVARSESLLGPYVAKDGMPALNNHFSLLLRRNELVVGPGHCSEIVEDDAGQTWLMYHGYQTQDVKASRVLYMDQILWDSNGWPYVVGDKSSICWSKPAFPAKDFTYSPVEYVEYDGVVDGDYLYDTGYVPKDDTRIEVKGQTYSKNGEGVETTGPYRAVFSSGTNDSDGYSVYAHTKSNRRAPDQDFWACYDGGFINDEILLLDYDTDFEFSVSRSSIVINGEEYPSDSSAYVETTARLTLFGGYRGNTYCGRIYSLMVYEGDALVHDYQPCVRNEDNMAMFHDTVTDTYVHPSDPRAFGYGPKVK